MVYCTKCGTKNLEDVEYCVKCGAGLDISFEERRIRLKNRKEAQCFGIRLTGGKLSLFIGVLMIVVVIFWLLNRYIPWHKMWSVTIICVGIYIILKVLSKTQTYQRREKR